MPNGNGGWAPASEIGYMEGMIPPPPGPALTPVDTSSFVEDILSNQEWYTPTGEQGGISSRMMGEPTTKQEEAYILDFMQKEGRAPTLREVERGFLRGFDITQSEYRPESTMGQMGFKNWGEYLEAQRFGEPYGPWAGSLVPEGGTVVTDEFGRPQMRFMERSMVPGHYLEKGRFIGEGGITPESDLWGLAGAGMEAYYPKYKRGPFQNPTMEESLGQYAPTDVYKARLNDYLTRQIDRDAPRVQGWQDFYNTTMQNFKDSLALEKIDEDAYNHGIIALRKFVSGKLDTLYLSSDTAEAATKTFGIKDKAKELAQQALDLINKGTPAEQLPMFADVGGVTGASVQELYNRMLQGTKGEYEKQQAAIPEWKGYPSPGVENQPTGNEQSQFLSYVESLGLAVPYSNWLKGEYWNLYNMWKQQGQFRSFIDFVSSYIATGGR